MGMSRKRASAALLGLAVGMACQAVLAQAIEEIVVTARRQGEEKLMETPLAITAFDADAIEARAISNLQDVASLTPGLTFFNPFGENLPTPIIRGVVPQNIFGENAAAIFIDGVYVAGREGLNFSQLDVARIEVMKGPQSSTYGRNAFSGAINYVTRAPSDVFESKVEGDLGNRGKQKISGQISGPIWGDTLTGRISLLYDEWDGSYDNTYGSDDIGGYRYRSYQGKLRWRPTDTLDVNLGLYSSNDEIDEGAVGGVIANCEDRIEQTSSNVTGRPYPRMLGYCGKIPRLRDLPQMLDPSQDPLGPVIPGSVRRDAMPKHPGALGEDRDLVRGHLTIDWDTDYGTLSALTGYSHMKQRSLSDFNRSSGVLPLVYCEASAPNAPPLPYCNLSSWGRTPMAWLNVEHGSTVEEWSQELRFTSPKDQRLRWQVGGYYFHLTKEQRPGTAVGTLPLPGDIGLGGDIGLAAVPGGTTFAIGSFVYGPSALGGADLDPLGRTAYEQKEESWSLFAMSEFDITDRLTGRLEGRVTEDHKRQEAYNYTPCNMFNDPVVGPVPPLGDQGTNFPLTWSDPGCGSLMWDLRERDPVGYQRWLEQPDGSFVLTDVPGVETAGKRFSTLTGRATLNYKMDSGWIAYGAIARGKQPGGLQLTPDRTARNASGSTVPVTLRNSFRPESLTSYELGLKGYTPDRRISLDLSVYFNDWKDIVLRQLTDRVPGYPDLVFDQPTGIDVNAGDAHVFGWELTAGVAMTDNLSARLTTAYADAVMKRARQDTYALYPSFYTTDPSCAPAEIQALPAGDQQAKADSCQEMSGDISGKRQMRQPQWTASLALDYKRQLFGDWDLKSSISANYTDKVFTLNDNQSWIPERTNVNFSIGMESPRYTVMLWVRNLFDNDRPMSAFRDIYFINTYDIQAQKPLGTPLREVSGSDDIMPLRMSVSYPNLRTWGVTARMRFGGAEK